MLSVCDYQWKRAITHVNLILEAKRPTGWRTANFSSFPEILCKPCRSLHLSMSAAISSADSCTFRITFSITFRASLTRASTSNRCQVLPKEILRLTDYRSLRLSFLSISLTTSQQNVPSHCFLFLSLCH